MYKILILITIIITITLTGCVNDNIIQSWKKEHDTISKEYYNKVLCKDGKFADGTQLTPDDIAARKFNYEQSEKTLQELLNK